MLAKVKGFDVFLSDSGKIKEEYARTLREWDIPYEEGGHTESLILNADEVVKSPGIPQTAPIVKALREADIAAMDVVVVAIGAAGIENSIPGCRTASATWRSRCRRFPCR